MWATRKVAEFSELDFPRNYYDQVLSSSSCCLDFVVIIVKSPKVGNPIASILKSNV